jgi:hypothetical protein
LFDETGRQIGTHFAGQSSQLLDGSKIIGKVPGAGAFAGASCHRLAAATNCRYTSSLAFAGTRLGGL